MDNGSRRVTITNGIAHVSFRGGGMFLPASNPYERQMLIEHIVNRLRSEKRMQILMDDLRWMVQLRQDPAIAQCSACGCPLNSTCYATDTHDAAHCLECAIGEHRGQGQPKQTPETKNLLMEPTSGTDNLTNWIVPPQGTQKNSRRLVR